MWKGTTDSLKAKPTMIKTMPKTAPVFASFKFFEITSKKHDKIIFGQVEHITGYTMIGKQARKGQINIKKPLGPTEEIYTDSNAVQKTFEQQRGQARNSEGLTADRRELIEKGILDNPISSPQKIVSGSTNSYFYGE